MVWTDLAWLTYRAAYTDARAGYLDELDFDLQGAITAIPTTAMRGTDNAALEADWTAALATILGNFTAARIEYLDDIKVLTRPQDGSQNTTGALAVIGDAIEDTVPFKVQGYISLHNMIAGDTFLVIEEVRDEDDATYREYGRNSYSGVQTSPMVRFIEKVARGWRVRIQRTAGADRAVTYQFFEEVASA